MSRWIVVVELARSTADDQQGLTVLRPVVVWSV